MTKLKLRKTTPILILTPKSSLQLISLHIKAVFSPNSPTFSPPPKRQSIVWVFANSGRGLRVSLDPSEPPSVCTRSSLPFHFLNSPHFYFPKIPSLKQRSDDEAKAEEDDTNPHSDTKIFSTTHLTTYQGSILSQLSDFFATTKKTEHCMGFR
jgi:hypothetical protein